MIRLASQAPMPLTTTGRPGASDLIHSISLHAIWASCDGNRLDTGPRDNAEPVGAGFRSARPVTCRMRFPSYTYQLTMFLVWSAPYDSRVDREPYRVSTQLNRLADVLLSLGPGASVLSVVSTTTRSEGRPTDQNAYTAASQSFGPSPLRPVPPRATWKPRVRALGKHLGLQLL